MRPRIGVCPRPLTSPKKEEERIVARAEDGFRGRRWGRRRGRSSDFGERNTYVRWDIDLQYSSAARRDPVQGWNGR